MQPAPLPKEDGGHLVAKRNKKSADAGFFHIKIDQKGNDSMAQFGQPLEEAELNKLSNSLHKEPNAEVLTRTITHNGIDAAAFDPQAAVRLDPVFSLELETGKVTNQKRSGRCWLFSAANMLRHQFAKQYKVKNFELSEKYLFFWDKIERANIFYDRVIATANRPLSDREVGFYFEMPDDDGGQWDMAAALVEKYGVVPVSAYPETANSEDTSALAATLNRKLRQDGLQLRQLIAEEKSDVEIIAAKENMLAAIYKITAYALGEPPMQFDLTYRDDDKQYHRVTDLTPQQFYQDYIDMDLSEYVTVTNSPDKPLNQLYRLPSEENVVGGRQIQFLNVEMDVLEQVALAQLQDGQAVWFGNDVMQQMDRKRGYLDSSLYRYSELFGVELQMTKAQRLETHEAEVSHAMTLTGADVVADKVTKWKVENSWGAKNGEDGYFTMSADWMNDFVYEVVVNKKYLTDTQRELLTKAPVELPAWDSLA